MIAGMPQHVLGDRNELAVAFVMAVPICVYLLGEYGKRSKILHLGLLGVVALLVIGVIGTQSRGGFIALLALAGYLFLKSDRKGLLGTLAIVLIAVLSQLVSSEWMERINSINDASEDASFMGRVVAWKMSFILAAQNPFFGGGFKAMENFPVWTELATHFHSYSWFYTGDTLPIQNRARAAHSIYFQVLGDQGFVGLALYLGCLIGAFRKAGKIAKTVKLHNGPAWLHSLAAMLQLSIFSFALGGAALSFAYFDLTFSLFGLVIVIEKRFLPKYVAGKTNSRVQPGLPPHYPQAAKPADSLKVVAQPLARPGRV